MTMTKKSGSAATVSTEAEQPNGIAPADSFDPSGAPIQIVPDVDPAHPAVDNDPRARTSAEQNKIDMNDPSLSGAEAVAQNLAAQRSE